jgi:hypothetical protein
MLTKSYVLKSLKDKELWRMGWRQPEFVFQKIKKNQNLVKDLKTDKYKFNVN